jgi:predicted transcriptional regulator
LEEIEIMKKSFKVKTRASIFNLINKNPGLHSRKIAQVLKISGQLADYHLLYLERNKIITAVKEDGYTRYYVKGILGHQERQRLSLLRQKTPLKIVLYLLKNPNSKHKELYKFIDIAPSTLSYHIKKLIKKDVLSSKVINNEVYFFVKDDKEIIQLLIDYKPQSLIDNSEDVWADFTL